MRLATLAASILLFAQPVAVSGQGATSLFVGNWVADLSKSRLDPKSQFKGATLTISVTADTVTLSSELVNASGQKQKGAETFRTDGTETAGTLTAGITHMARWVGPQVLATVANKGGDTVFVIIYQVSPDGRTLTARSSGLLEQVVVFTRK